MKRVYVDCNFNWFGPRHPSLSKADVEKYDLRAGEKIIAYQDDDEWEGIVFFDDAFPSDHKWYVKI